MYLFGCAKGGSLNYFSQVMKVYANWHGRPIVTIKIEIVIISV